MQTFKDFIHDNFPWICGVVLSACLLAGSVFAQGLLITDIKENMKDVKRTMENYEIRMDSMEKSMCRMEIYQESISENIKDIKRRLTGNHLSRPTNIEITKDTPLEDIEPDFAYMK